ncbi:hypothetical protein AAFC00_000620 [Neodothiora populina]|uniref:Uncharacterized protein n=1 Tax=Neodothiora populina TaxID=2781224 RepID=A0ABR3PDG8_9PEZI
MFVPRSFKYSSLPSSPPPTSKTPKVRRGVHDTRSTHSRPSSVDFEPSVSSPLAAAAAAAAASPHSIDLLHPHRDSATESFHSTTTTPTTTTSTAHPTTSMSTRQASKPVEIPTRPQSRGETQAPASHHTRSQAQRPRRKSPTTSSHGGHRSDSLPPAVAALLAVTAIPPPRRASSAARKRMGSPSPRISIDELVHEWRHDSSLRSSFGSGASMDFLLEPTDDTTDERSSYSRSSSCDSIPSLEADDQSVLSVGSPATPDSIRSRRSNSATPRKERAICCIEPEDCGLEHPLGTSDMDSDDFASFIFPVTPSKDAGKRKSMSFKSNLTSSFKAFKSRALSSISSLNQAISQTDAVFSDESLWQHPYVFPRLSSEVRPKTFATTPTRSQRRYLNPATLPFEEQQHHWSQALSTVDEDMPTTPMIQMQTYRRLSPAPSRKPRRNSGTPDSRSEAGRALAAPLAQPQMHRQREVRENSNFLRVIVLEMNMRRNGKFEEGTAGKAKIWLPPRRVVLPSDDVFEDESDEDELIDGPVARRVPKRWVGITAEY